MKRISSYVNGIIVNEAVEDRIDVQELLQVLYKRYAEEVLQWYHYHIVSNFLVGKERPDIEKTFKEMGDDELNDHAEQILDRINELNGDIEQLKDIDNLKALSECDYKMPELPYDTRQLVAINIEHEKCAIKGYEALCDFTRGKDEKTYRMAQGILADEEEHLNSLNEFLADIDYIK